MYVHCTCVVGVVEESSLCVCLASEDTSVLSFKYTQKRQLCSTSRPGYTTIDLIINTLTNPNDRVPLPYSPPTAPH